MSIGTTIGRKCGITYNGPFAIERSEAPMPVPWANHEHIMLKESSPRERRRQPRPGNVRTGTARLSHHIGGAWGAGGGQGSRKVIAGDDAVL